MARWADFNGPPPGAAALIRAGFTGVIRYIGLGSEGKQIHRSEYEDYTRNGMGVLLVAELGINDAWAAFDDHATGVARAQVALADARAEGIPDYVGIACAADAHATSKDQIADAVQYARGFADVLGKSRTGFYGFSETSVAVHNADIVGWHWRCGSAPSAADSEWVNFWQRNVLPTTVTVNGTVCDINESLADIAGGDDMTPGQAEQLQMIFNALFDTERSTYKITLIDMAHETYKQMASSEDAVGGVTVPDRLVAMAAKVDTLQVGGMDVVDLSTRLTASLGPALAAELGRRLVEGTPS